MNNNLVKGISFGGSNINKEPNQEFNFSMQFLCKAYQLFSLGDEYWTTDMVANYFEVPNDIIETMVNQNKDELLLNGLIISSMQIPEDIKEYIKDLVPEPSLIILYNRRVIINIAMLLENNMVAKTIRKIMNNGLI